MEKFNPEKKEGPQKKSITDKATNFIKSALLSKLIDNSKMDKTLADNLYANRILEEEIIAPNKSYLGFTPSLPEGTKIVDVYGAHYANIGDKMYYMREFEGGFDLIDNTKDFIPDKYLSRRQNKKRAAFQKQYGLSDTTEAISRDEFYSYDESTSDLDNWIIHNDMGKIKKSRLNKDLTWWLKGKPYKGVFKRSLFDKPHGRHLFAKQSALEASIGRPLDQHMEQRGSIINEGNVQNGGITITPTSEADLPNIKGLKSFTYNPITKSIERGIFYDPNKPEDKNSQNENLGEHEDVKK